MTLYLLSQMFLFVVSILTNQKKKYKVQYSLKSKILQILRKNNTGILEYQMRKCCEKYVSIVHSHRNKEPPPNIQWPSKQCLYTNPSLIFFLLFPKPRWQTGRLLKVIRAVPPGPLEPRWWPGHIPKCSCCSRPQQRQAHWGATSLSPWRWGDRLATAHTHTFMVSDSVSLRRLPA